MFGHVRAFCADHNDAFQRGTAATVLAKNTITERPSQAMRVQRAHVLPRRERTANSKRPTGLMTSPSQVLKPVRMIATAVIISVTIMAEETATQSLVGGRSVATGGEVWVAAT